MEPRDEVVLDLAAFGKVRTSTGLTGFEHFDFARQRPKDCAGSAEDSETNPRSD